MHDVSRLQGEIRSREKLLQVNAGRYAVVDDKDLAWIGGPVVGCRHNGLGQGQALRPRYKVISDLTVDRDAWPLILRLKLLHLGDACLLAREIGVARLGVSLALGHTAAERQGQRQEGAYRGEGPECGHRRGGLDTSPTSDLFLMTPTARE